VQRKANTDRFIFLSRHTSIFWDAWKVAMVFDDSCFQRMLTAHESANFPGSGRRNHRRWSNQTATTALEVAAAGCDFGSPLCRLPGAVDLHLGTLVRIPRLLFSVLVHLQDKDRAISYFSAPHLGNSAPGVLANRTRVHFVRF
jgi:hypothetical protein